MSFWWGLISSVLGTRANAIYHSFITRSFRLFNLFLGSMVNLRSSLNAFVRGTSLKCLSDHDFVLCRWQTSKKPSINFLICRIIICLYLCTSLIVSILDLGRGAEAGIKYEKWMAYLTNWGYLILSLQSLVGLGLLVHYFINYAKGCKTISSLHSSFISTYWALFTIAATFSPAISTAFWLVIYDSERDDPSDPISVMTHAVNSIVIFIDQLISIIPLRFSHIYLPFLLSFTYLLFSFIYYLCGGTDRHQLPYIYKMLDWRKPGWAIVACVGGLTYVCFVHVFMTLFNYGINRIIPPKVLKEEKSVTPQINEFVTLETVDV